ncbi:MAG: hypothetical protein EA351_00110 [Gemmatimonadales bacterium]|nr:MAG: hypothetical protein EA351_00110 [Gemmatimonadales bacterium]
MLFALAEVDHQELVTFEHVVAGGFESELAGEGLAALRGQILEEVVARGGVGRHRSRDVGVGGRGRAFRGLLSASGQNERQREGEDARDTGRVSAETSPV